MRSRRAALEQANRRFRMSRLTGEFRAPPLSHKERNELRFLRPLFPARDLCLSQLDGELEIPGYHPFRDELPTLDGNFYPRYLPPDVADERKWRQQLEEIERKDLALKEAAKDQQKSEIFIKSRMRDLQERRAVGFAFTALEEQELRDLREHRPEFAAVLDLLDLQYLYEWKREVERARKAGLNTFAMFEQAEVICLRLRDPTKFTTELEAEECRRTRSSKATEAVSERLASERLPE